MAEETQVQEKEALEKAPKEPLFSKKNKKLLSDPLDDDNPITVQVLGICSALAITVQVEQAFVMSLSVLFVLVAANVIISLLRSYIPTRVRIIVQLVVVASLVIPGRPGAEGLCLRCEQATFCIRWIDHYELYHHGTIGSFCTW